MKCIKNKQTGEIIRIDDSQAHNLVGTRFSYVPKSEWKSISRTQTEPQAVEAEKKERTMSKKAAKRLKIKEQQRQ